MDCGRPAELCGVVVPVSCGRAEPRRQGRRPGVLRPAALADPAPHAELVDAHGFLARLVWSQVRPRGRTPSEPRPRRDAAYPAKASPGWVGVPDVGPPCRLTSTSSVTTAHAASLVSLPGSMETLWSQLVRRRLRRLATKEEF